MSQMEKPPVAALFGTPTEVARSGEHEFVVTICDKQSACFGAQHTYTWDELALFNPFLPWICTMHAKDDGGTDNVHAFGSGLSVSTAMPRVTHLPGRKDLILLTMDNIRQLGTGTFWFEGMVGQLGRDTNGWKTLKKLSYNTQQYYSPKSMASIFPGSVQKLRVAITLGLSSKELVSLVFAHPESAAKDARALPDDASYV